MLLEKERKKERWREKATHREKQINTDIEKYWARAEGEGWGQGAGSRPLLHEGGRDQGRGGGCTGTREGGVKEEREVGKL